MRDFSFQIRQSYATILDSLQSGGQGLVKIEMLLLLVFHQFRHLNLAIIFNSNMFLCLDKSCMAQHNLE
jgi:hypothetical protein